MRQEVIDIIKEYFGEENVDATDNVYVVVYFPEITIQNEYEESHTILDTYVKFGISNTGTFVGDISLVRTTYDNLEFNAGYVHSHVPILREHPKFLRMCLGTGPINHTISYLGIAYNKVSWELFCAELEELLKVESISGGPYMRMSRITNYTNNCSYVIAKDIKACCTALPTEILSFANYLIDNYNFLVCQSRCVSNGKPYHELIVEISNIYIKWANEEILKGADRDTLTCYLEKAVWKDGNLCCINNNNRSCDFGTRILVFNGQPKNLKIIKKEEESGFWILYPHIIEKILSTIYILLNHERTTNKTNEDTYYIL